MKTMAVVSRVADSKKADVYGVSIFVDGHEKPLRFLSAVEYVEKIIGGVKCGDKIPIRSCEDGRYELDL